MKKIARNEPCPCGSGKKFKKCHLGREDELIVRTMAASQQEVGAKITNLPEVRYGRSKEIMEGIDIQALTGKTLRVRLVDLAAYRALTGFEEEATGERSSASQIINPKKTKKSDPDALFIALTPNINDSTLIHQIAHILAFLKDSVPLPGTYSRISEETHIPVEHLDHPKEFADWLDFLRDRFDVKLDAEDTIVSFLNENGILLTRQEAKGREGQFLISRSARIFDFLREHQQEIDLLIRHREGYVGSSKEG